MTELESVRLERIGDPRLGCPIATVIYGDLWYLMACRQSGCHFSAEPSENSRDFLRLIDD